MDTYDKILEALKEVDESDLIYAWNDYCDAANYPDDRIWGMGELDDVYGYDVFNGMSVSEVAEKIRRDFEDFDFDADYFVITIYGYESGDSLDDFDVFNFEDLADYMYRNDDALGISEIQDILDEEDEIEDDEDEE